MRKVSIMRVFVIALGLMPLFCLGMENKISEDYKLEPIYDSGKIHLKKYNNNEKSAEEVIFTIEHKNKVVVEFVGVENKEKELQGLQIIKNIYGQVLNLSSKKIDLTNLNDFLKNKEVVFDSSKSEAPEITDRWKKFFTLCGSKFNTEVEVPLTVWRMAKKVEDNSNIKNELESIGKETNSRIFPGYHFEEDPSIIHSELSIDGLALSNRVECSVKKEIVGVDDCYSIDSLLSPPSCVANRKKFKLDPSLRQLSLFIKKEESILPIKENEKKAEEQPNRELNDLVVGRDTELETNNFQKSGTGEQLHEGGLNIDVPKEKTEPKINNPYSFTKSFTWFFCAGLSYLGFHFAQEYSSTVKEVVENNPKLFKNLQWGSTAVFATLGLIQALKKS